MLLVEPMPATQTILVNPVCENCCHWLRGYRQAHLRSSSEDEWGWCQNLIPNQATEMVTGEKRVCKVGLETRDDARCCRFSRYEKCDYENP